MPSTPTVERHTPLPWHVETDAVEYKPSQRSPYDDYGASIKAGETDVVIGGCQDEQGGAVGILRNADAAFIVTAVNAHDDLVAALKLIAAQAGMTLIAPSMGPDYDQGHQLGANKVFDQLGANKVFDQMADIARAALAKVQS